MHSESTNLDAVFARDGLDGGRLAGDFDELLACVPVLVDVADVPRGHGAVEGDGDCVLGDVSMSLVGDGEEREDRVDLRGCLGTRQLREE